MEPLLIYHGSSDIINRPVYGLGNLRNDYGRGFYCTEHPELAKEWAVADGRNGYINTYEFDFSNLRVMQLSSDRYHVLNWLAILLENRLVSLHLPLAIAAKNYLLENFLPDYKGYDVIIGYRADDSYFSFARAFVSNQISLQQLSRAMKLGKLGEQIVLRSPKAFDQLHFLKAEEVSHITYYPKKKSRDSQARNDYLNEAQNADIHGLFIRDIILEAMQNDDPRLR